LQLGRESHGVSSKKGSGLARGREAAAHGIFCDSPGEQELQQVIRAARLGADARKLEPAERLSVYEGARDLAVDVQVADTELPLDAGDVVRAARVQSAREGVGSAVGDLQGVLQVTRPQYGQH